MHEYLKLLQHVQNNGTVKKDRTGTGTKSVFGYQMRFDLKEGFPLVTTKKCHLKSIIHELLWFLSGDTNITYLKDNKVKIWDAWATETGDLGPVYGAQWRSWQNPDGSVVDQIKELIHNLIHNPDSRRHVISAWNPSVLPSEDVSPQQNVKNGKMALPPCHTLFQFYVANGELSCQLYQRSADVFLGVPFNIASYAILTMILAEQCNLGLGSFVHTLGDAHMYLNHQEQVKTQLTRCPHKLPKLEINPNVNSIFDYTIDDFNLVGYDPYPKIPAPIAV